MFSITFRLWSTKESTEHIFRIPIALARSQVDLALKASLASSKVRVLLKGEEVECSQTEEIRMPMAEDGGGRKGGSLRRIASILCYTLEMKV